MNMRMLFALALTLLAVSACVIEPVDGRGYNGHGYYGGGPDRGVWRD